MSDTSSPQLDRIIFATKALTALLPSYLIEGDDERGTYEEGRNCLVAGVVLRIVAIAARIGIAKGLLAAERAAEEQRHREGVAARFQNQDVQLFQKDQKVTLFPCPAFALLLAAGLPILLFDQSRHGRG